MTAAGAQSLLALAATNRPRQSFLAAHWSKWSLTHHGHSASSEQYHGGEDVREHGDILKAISVDLEHMIRSSKGVEHAANQRSRQLPGRDKEAQHAEKTYGDICKAELANQDQGLSILETQDHMRRVLRLSYLL